MSISNDVFENMLKYSNGENLKKMSLLSKEIDSLVRPKIAKLKLAWNQITEMYKLDELQFPDRYYSLGRHAQDGYEIRKASVLSYREPKNGDMYCSMN